MASASWLRWLFAAVLTASALYHLARLITSRFVDRPSEFDVDLTHTGMGLVMAAMLLGPLPVLSSGEWALVFAVPTARFAGRAVRGYRSAAMPGAGHPLRQAVACAAMPVMLAVPGAAGTAAGTGGASMAGMPGMADGSGMRMGGGGPVLLVLLVATLVVAAWSAAPLAARRGAAGAGPVGAGPAGGVLAPRFTSGCQVAMNVSTAYLLMLMI